MKTTKPGRDTGIALNIIGVTCSEEATQQLVVEVACERVQLRLICILACE